MGKGRTPKQHFEVCPTCHRKTVNNVKAAVPLIIQNLLEIKPGDKLEWKPDFRDGRAIAIVSKRMKDGFS